MRIKLIIVEDQTMIRQLLEIACKQALPEAEVFSVQDGAGAVELSRRERPDIVVLDLGLPDGDGLEFVPAIQEAANGVKVLVLSSRTDEFALHCVESAGVNGFVDKNGQTIDVLREALKVLLSGRSYYCSVTKAVRSQMKSDPASFSKMLSDREMELLCLLGSGASNEEVAGRVGLSPNTVRNHRQNIMTKLGLGSTPQLMRYALEKGFIRGRR